jgi:hypothetical protein
MGAIEVLLHASGEAHEHGHQGATESGAQNGNNKNPLSPEGIADGKRKQNSFLSSA